MVEVYYYLPAEEADNAVECGLKLSEWSDREAVIDGENVRCLSALLSPKDDMDKYRSDLLKCVKIELPNLRCYVADRFLYEAGLDNPEIMKIYMRSIIPVDSYIFGIYRFPECLITGSVIAGQITIMNKGLDSPILFDNSEQLYINNIMETLQEQSGNINDCMLYYFYSKLAEIGKVDKIEVSEKKMVVFIDRKIGRTIKIKVPDIQKL